MATGFGAGDIRGPQPPDFGGPVRNATTGEWEFPSALPLADPWKTVCGREGQCGDKSRVPGPGSGSSEFTDDGDVGLAVGRAAERAKIVRHWAPPMALLAERCFSSGGSLRLDLASGSLRPQGRPPAGGDFDPVPVLTYNAQSTEATDFGFGWSHAYRRRLANITGTSIDVVEGDGTVWHYTGMVTPMNPYYTPPAGAKNSLHLTFVETQPDGLQMRYDVPPTQKLLHVKNPAGRSSLRVHENVPPLFPVQNFSRFRRHGIHRRGTLEF